MWLSFIFPLPLSKDTSDFVIIKSIFEGKSSYSLRYLEMDIEAYSYK